MWRVWVMLCSKERFEKAFAHYWQEAIENVTFVYLGTLKTQVTHS